MRVAGASEFEAWEADLHGHRAVYRQIGSGPPVVLVHGMLNSSRHWEEVARRLADRYTVIAPDLIGHGDSATPRGDYSLGAHAAAIRDLLVAIDVPRASFVGHSLGGGVAMQFFWQFPERVERLALVSSGGLGEGVSPALRAAALPGASVLLRAIAHRWSLERLSSAASALERRGAAKAPYVRALVRALRPLQSAGGREAFLQTLRSVIDSRGQRVGATDRLYLLAPVPTAVIWGGRDRTIPVSHGRRAHELIPNSSFELLERAAHFPHLEDPDGLAVVLDGFLATTAPATLGEAEWAELIGTRTAHRRHLRAA